VTDQKREHIAKRDCWCNPYVLTVNDKVLTEYAGKVVRTDQISLGRVLVHIEPHEETKA
jgi:hypothetical protein